VRQAAGALPAAAARAGATARQAGSHRRTGLRTGGDGGSHGAVRAAPGGGRPARLLLSLLLATSAGCATAHRSLRPSSETIQVAASDLGSAEGRRRVSRASLERHDTFTLGVVEFDDQGYYWDRRQADALVAEIRREAEGPGQPAVLVNVFVHGWRHTADVCDSNLCCFREALGHVARRQAEVLAVAGDGRKPSKIFGVFVGWRGLSKRVWPFEHFSFLSRKNVATKVGAGHMTEFLTRLDRLREELNAGGRERSRLVVVGHSLGATVVYTAVSGVLKSRLAEAYPGFDPRTGQARLIRGFGDLVILVNPALDAVAFHPLWELAERFTAFARSQRPLVVVLGSETDSATGTFFPVGQTVATLFERTRDREQRRALRTAVGNYEPFVSYRLAARSPAAVEGGPEPKVDDCRCRLPYEPLTSVEKAEIERGTRTGDAGRAAKGGVVDVSRDGTPCEPSRTYGQTVLSCVKPVLRGNPIRVIRAAPEVLHEHGGFYNPLLGDFLRRLLIGSDPDLAPP